MEFNRKYLIRFAHCDSAGIVFYPQYFVMFNDHIEDWFNEELGLSFADLHMVSKLGVPTVHIDCDFANPSRLGDLVDYSLEVTRLGRASMTLSRTARVGKDVRVRMNQVLACLDLTTGKARPWPEQLRTQISRFTHETHKDEGNQ